MDPQKAMAALDPKTQAFSLLSEFKAFALKGNVIDLAVGVIIGAAFGKIVDSLVKDIIMPLIGMIMPGDQDYRSWAWEYGGQKVLYGQTIAEVVNFLIVALALFLFIVKFMGFILRTKKLEAAAPPPLTKDQELLIEIRDTLKQQKV